MLHKTVSIFIADDDHDDHFFFGEALASSGAVNCNITAFYDGRQLIEYLSVIDSEDMMPDAIVLDLNMPVLDGMSALEKLKSDRRFDAIPVFILTTSASQDQMKKCQRLGCREYYIKPVKLEELKHIVEDIILKSADNP